MKKVVFLDRDGTIIIDKVYLNDPNAIEYLPGAFDALRLLRDRGFEFIVVTNQSGLASRVVDIKNLDIIHSKISDEFARHGVSFLGFYYAPFSVESQHWVRKPNPGMLLLSGRDHDVDFSASWMVGDRLSDIEAGHRAGARTVFLSEVPAPENVSMVEHPDYTTSSLLDAARFIAEHS